ncbi:phosphotransferase family protein [Sulfitobacter sp. D35]|uniref:phosphotransferase family protein n=1 Tax=Sulfitobacter sp. D35 TaxID=3083252 RepID=UPI00296F40A5|nr:phosphotransferase family protein [Sulfitobacter sp. D35]MDW4499537.1 phosphotransferase family protein [Sulfitobacter sp. D35]
MHQYDQTDLQDYLRAYVEGFDRLDAIEKFSDGQSNPTYKVTSGDRRFVLRAKPPGKLLKSAHAVDREFRVMRALAETDVPVPRVLHLSEAESPFGTQFYVMDMIDGRIFWDPALPELDASVRARIYDDMNRVLAALHSVDVAAAGLSDFGKPGNYFARQTARWSGQYRDSETEPLADVDWLMGWLDDHMVEDDGTISVVHGDYRIDNMIFAPDREEVRALLDWELSTLGHPFADLAYQCMHWRLPHKGGFRGLGGVDRADLGLPSEEDYVARYCERRGIAAPENWRFYVVFSYFRLLAILQGVLKRALDGNASNPRDVSQTRAVVELMARDARALAAA